ncbi:peptidoglycan editing factor PgeF [Halalkalibacter urbisdiaboli]|uniref:peptidoglycan editing factor PgeF n=1 Tax=Halalkalibacter urbisdiaboli TaxID=1960589 RepID=UPI001FD8B66D|nr:peptidoglycan editing factor PgeF [Halalkalibacter urbisdiaboli]
MLTLEPFIENDKEYLLLEPWRQLHPELVVGFSTRVGGVSQPPFDSLNLGLHVNDSSKAVIENRRILAKKLGIPVEQWVGSEQVHRASITKVTAKDAGMGILELDSAIKGMDGIYTNEKNLLLTSLYADCVPLYFFSPKQMYIGLAHAGWRGTVKGIGPNMVKILSEDEGIPLEEIYVAIGPCISQEAYEVDEEVIAEVNHVLPEKHRKSCYHTNTNKGYQLNLREVNKCLLMESGIKVENILVSSICTSSDSRMYSHRTEAGKTGRMMSFIGLI